MRRTRTRTPWRGAPLRSGIRPALLAVAVSLVLLLLVPQAAPAADAPLVAGFRVDQAQPVTTGVDYYKLVRDDGPVVAHVVRVKRDAPLDLRTVLSNDGVAEPPPQAERTSDMCRRVQCIVALNGDFSVPGTGAPVGGMASQGRMLRSPLPDHEQLSVTAGGDLTTAAASWSGQVATSDLQSVPLGGINRERRGEAVLLYTPSYGASTGTDSSGTEIVLRMVDLPLPVATGQTAVVELVALRDGGGNTPIPADGGVLSAAGGGAGALRALWDRANASLLGPRALLRLETSPALLESIGGSPALLRQGQRVPVDHGSDFASGLHPRTVVGWNQNETFLVAIDGRQEGYSIGLALAEAADLLHALGAQDAINLDGGGSTTLVVAGTVVNRPSDRLVAGNGEPRVVTQPAGTDTVLGAVERPVANGLTVVASTPLSLLNELLGPNLIPAGSLSPAAAPDDPASQLVNP